MVAVLVFTGCGLRKAVLDKLDPELAQRGQAEEYRRAAAVNTVSTGSPSPAAAKAEPSNAAAKGPQNLVAAKSGEKSGLPQQWSLRALLEREFEQARPATFWAEEMQRRIGKQIADYNRRNGSPISTRLLQCRSDTLCQVVFRFSDERDAIELTLKRTLPFEWEGKVYMFDVQSGERLTDYAGQDQLIFLQSPDYLLVNNALVHVADLRDKLDALRGRSADAVPTNKSPQVK